ncbi:hypothetical protein [Crassaminicella profunda]|uniref:hypothetical protein n=1 Tax=Crassaminicella profunda TaxID=1286698 RepID=UPI001CA71417|nr:hypothetical protein [Crassaminicella profunda]QZY57172.1 hypothetical protein K7H06_09735 [Crassaminicella profunda]
MKQEKFIQMIHNIIDNYLRKKGLLTHEWHLGIVTNVNANGTLNVYINGSPNISPSIPANQDITFEAGNPVWVHFVNRNPQSLFVPYKRQIVSQ